MIHSVLFDLGGVLEEIDAASKIEKWTNGLIPAKESLNRWLTAKSVRLFETGRISSEEFASLVVRELCLDILPEEFLEEFSYWLLGPIDGAVDLVSRVKGNGFQVASFSNSNAIHWPIMELHLCASNLFQENFPSHMIGICKPDKDAFLEASRRWGVAPENILFLDDSAINCQGARSIGMRASQVIGVEGAHKALINEGIL